MASMAQPEKPLASLKRTASRVLGSVTPADDA